MKYTSQYSIFLHTSIMVNWKTRNYGATILFFFPISMDGSSFCQESEYSCKKDGITHCEPLEDRGDKMLPIEKPACRQGCQESQMWCEERNKCVHKSEVCDCGPDKIYCSKGGKYSCENRKGILTSSVFKLCQDGRCRGTCEAVQSVCSQGHFQCGGQCKNVTLVVEYRQCSENCIPANLLCYKPGTNIILIIVLVIVSVLIVVVINVLVYLWKRGFLEKLECCSKFLEKISVRTDEPINNCSHETAENNEGLNEIENNVTINNVIINNENENTENRHIGNLYSQTNKNKNGERGDKYRKQTHEKDKHHNNDDQSFVTGSHLKCDKSKNRNTENQHNGSLHGYTNMNYLEDSDGKFKSNNHEKRNQEISDESKIAPSSPIPYHTMLLSSFVTRGEPRKKNTRHDNTTKKHSGGLHGHSNSKFTKDTDEEYHIKQNIEKGKQTNIAPISPSNYNKTKGNNNRKSHHNEDIYRQTNDDESEEEYTKEGHRKRIKDRDEDQNEVVLSLRSHSNFNKQNTKQRHTPDLHNRGNNIEERVEQYEKHSHINRKKSNIYDRNGETTNTTNDHYFRKKREGTAMNTNCSTKEGLFGEKVGNSSRKSSNSSPIDRAHIQIRKNTPIKTKQDRHSNKGRH